MKFICFGDLVEVTYGDGSIELVSKEKATELGYKERQDTLKQYSILYQGCIYSINGFSLLTGITYRAVRKYYNEGLHTGEEIIEAFNKHNIKIIYLNREYNCVEFAKLINTSVSTVSKYYNKGLHTGEEIIEAFNNCNIKIAYLGKVYNRTEFAKLINTTTSTVSKYYNKGLHTGEEIIEAIEKQKELRQEITITYQNKTYNSISFAELTKISATTIANLYKKGLCTGEEIIAACRNTNQIKISYKSNLYSVKQFSNITGIDPMTVYKYYYSGANTGEEIIARYEKGKELKSGTKITYQNKIYNGSEFSKLTDIPQSTISKYYVNGLCTGEEILAAYNKQKDCRQKIKITYQGSVYNSNQFRQLTGISHSTIVWYYNRGITSGEEILKHYNESKNPRKGKKNNGK